MSRDAARLGAEVRLSLLAVATTWFALLAWRGFTEDSYRFLSDLVVVAGAVALLGALARWRRVPPALALLLQIPLVAVIVSLQTTGQPFPGPAFGDALDLAAESARTYVAPVPFGPGSDIQPLLLLGGALALVAVEFLAAGLRRVPVSGLPLLIVFTLPVSLLEGGLSWWVFVASAVGFLGMLFLQEQESLARWGRSLDGDGEPVVRLSESARARAVGVGAVAVVTAVLLPLVVPTLDLEVLEVGQGDGGDGDIDIRNPLVDLRRDLVRGNDVPLIQIVTDQPNPSHLRIGVLNRFTDNEWSSGNRDVKTDQRAQGRMPPLEGVPDSVPRRTYDYDVTIDDDFDSIWLPTQAPITEIYAEGDWRYDIDDMDFLASEDDLTTRGAEYSMTAVDLEYDQEQLLAADGNPTGLSDEVTALPDDLSQQVRSLAGSVTSEGTSPFAKAALLQDWFRDPERGGFEYDINQVESAGEIGTDELETFLLDEEQGRRGYCEQFAAAMAVMARVLGIPARVAVGFLEPDQTGPDTYVYSAHDLHAWVELYFEGAGWVLFDPTPAGRVAADLVPSYTQGFDAGPLPSGPGPSEEVSRTSASAPTGGQSSRPTVTPRPEQPVDARDADTDGGPGWVVPVLVGLGVLALLVLLALLPRTIRARQRARRLAGDAEDAWDELWATCLDLGRRWPDGRSPAQTERIVAHWFGRVGDDDERPAHGVDRAPAATAALARITRSIERSRYARGHREAAGVHADDVELCVEALTAGVAPRARRRAQWLPASITAKRVRATRSEEVEDSEETPGALVEHL